MHSEKFLKYTKESWSGKRLLAEHQLSARGIWKIIGENDSPDGMGGNTPELGIVEGILLDVINYALTLDRFWMGEIRFISESITTVNAEYIRRREMLKLDIKAAEAELERMRTMLAAMK